MSRQSLWSLLLLQALGFAQPHPQAIVPCPPGTAGGVICLAGNLSGSLQSGQVYHVFLPSQVIQGDTLVVEPGAIVKMSGFNGALAVSGVLTVNTGAVFTSIHDDAEGGDTNGNGAATTPAPGDWGVIAFNQNSDASTVSGAHIKYGGAGIRCFQADITIDLTEIEFCGGDAISLQGSSFATITDCRLDSNLGRAISDCPIGALPNFSGNTATGNQPGNYVDVTDSAFGGGNVVIQPGNLINGTMVVCTQINVPAGLTLDLRPGVLVKLDACGPPVIRQFLVDGTMIADGVAFTDIRDDAIGGDTNADGGATVPVPGSWSGFRFMATSDASVLRNVVVAYAGAFGTVSSIQLTGADVTLDTVLVKDGDRAALDLFNSSFPTVVGCAFQNNSGVAVTNVPLAAVPGFNGNAAAGNTGGDYLLIDDAIAGTGGMSEITGSTVITTANTLNGTGLLVSASSWRVTPGATLTLDQGVVCKWRDDNGSTNLRVEAQGTLLCNGTAGSPVVFTSSHDDTVAGDSNLNGGATTPAPGAWGGIWFTAASSASQLAGVELRFGGGGAIRPLYFVGVAGPTIQNCLVDAALSDGLRTQNAAPIVDGCHFSNCGGVAIRGLDIDAVPGFTNNTAQNNAGDYMRVEGGVVDGNPTIDPVNTLNQTGVLVLNDDVDVPVGKTLSLLQGVIFKFETSLGSVDVDGTLIAGSLGPNPVVFTMLADDAFGGDTNGDGGGTVPQPGDWFGLEFGNGADGSQLDNVIVRWAGRLNFPSVDLTFADVTIRNSVIENGLGDGLDLSGNSFPTLQDNDLRSNRIAVVNAPIAALPGFSGNSASLNLLGDYVRVTQGDVPANATLLISPSMSLDARPFVVADDVIIPATSTLVLDPGTQMKFDGNRDVLANGDLSVPASAATPVTFTSLHDDLVGGDTNKDGAATLALPGDWGQVILNAATTTVQGLLVRFAGAGGVGSIRTGADARVLDCVVESGAGPGLDVGTFAHPEVRGSRFDDCTVAIVGVPLDAVPLLRDNVGSGNSVGDYVRVQSASWTGPLNIHPVNSLNGDGVFVVDAHVTVDAPDTLVFAAGCVIKWKGPGRTLSVVGACRFEGTGKNPVVFTVLSDDAVVGDTNKDGAASSPTPGGWNRIHYTVQGQGSAEHLTVRYGGSGGLAPFVSDTDQVTARAVRSDHSADDGIGIGNLGGDLTNAVVCAAAAHGINVAGGAFDVVHATVTGCGGAGIRSTSTQAVNVLNSISFANVGGAFVGFGANAVVASNGDPALAGVLGNVFADPQFVDPAAGDLRLQPTSPCIDIADQPTALATGSDHLEHSRVLDHDLDGALGPDMGAFERSAYDLDCVGVARLGTAMTFTVVGDPGVAYVAFGLLQNRQFLPPFGVLLIGDLNSITIVSTTTVGAPVTIGLPLDPSFAGLEVGVQGLGLPFLSPGLGGVTDVARARLFQ